MTSSTEVLTMEDVLVRSVLLSVPQAAAIWLVIVAVAVTAMAALWLPGRRPARDDPDQSGHSGGDASGPAADRAAADRYAAEIEAAADRAAATARRGRDAWERAQAHLELTWEAFEAADRVARRSSAAAAFGPPDAGSPDADPVVGGPVVDGPVVDGPVVGGPVVDGPGGVEVDGRGITSADRERYLHRAATAACRRRELTVHELNDILAHRGDWDPQRHPVEQEVALHRAVRRRALAAYSDAATRERQAWRTAEVAAEALRSLREEACVARLQADAPVTTAPLWWAGHAPEPTGIPHPTPASDESLTTMALPMQLVAEDVEATMALPVQLVAEDVEATMALPVSVTVDDVVTVPDVAPTVPLPLPVGASPVGASRVGAPRVGASPVGPLMVVPLPPAALAALQVQTVAAVQAQTVPLPTVATGNAGPSGAGSASTAEVGPVVPAQAGAPSAESLRQPLAAAGVDAAGR